MAVERTPKPVPLGRKPEFRPKITQADPETYIEFVVDCPNCETVWYVQLWDEEANEMADYCPGCGERRVEA